MKKLFILIFCMILLVGSVSAMEIDNKLTYYENDLKVELTNWFGLGVDYGTAELKSHKSVDEIRDVAIGKDRVVMYYDFDFLELYENGLGKVYFTDERTGEEIEKNYSFVYWTNETYEKDIYEEQCSKSLNQTNICEQVVTGKENATREVWKPYNSKDIQKGKMRIGLQTDVKLNDLIDGVWTIAGKEIEKHAEWTANLNVGLVSYYKLDENAANTLVLDSVLLNNGTSSTNTNNLFDVNGIINSAFDFESTNSENVKINNGAGVGEDLDLLEDFSFSLWIKLESVGGGEHGYMIGKRSAGGFQYVFRVENSGNIHLSLLTTGGAIADTNALSLATWYHVVVTRDDDGNTIFYINGTAKDSAASNSVSHVNTDVFLADSELHQANTIFDGVMDEVGIWNRILTPSEVTQLYNGGSGISFELIPQINITLNSPVNNFNSTSQTINFNGTISVLAPDNVTLFIDDVGNETNSSGILGNYLFTKILSEGTHTWNYEACSSDECNNGTARTFTIDTIFPTINITFPNVTIDFYEINTNLSVNWTINDSSLDTCILEFEGVNRTVTCLDNQTEINITNNVNKTIIFYVNDTVGNMNSSSVTWDYKIFGSNHTFNTSSSETKSETFSINLTANSSLTEVVLDYNGTDYSTTKSGTVYSRTLDVPTGTFNKTFKWKSTYAGDTIESTEYNQNISVTNFSICDGSLTDDFLNISFKDEDDLSVLNASIPTSNFIYYLGSGLVNKTYAFSNVSNNFNYAFCATPDETLNVDAFIQYKQGTDYPQRIYNPELISYTSTVTNQILYLLNSLDGIFVTFQIINSIEQGISGVKVNGTREISGEDVEVASGTTDAAGSVTFWLNPDFLHLFNFIKSGFQTASLSIFPTQPAYTITLTGGEGTGSFDYSRGIAISTRPVGSVLNDTLTNFNYTISSSFWVLEEFGFTLGYSNGTLIGTKSSTENTGGTLVLNAITGNNGSIIMNYYYLINSTFINGTSTWHIFKSNEYSIQHLLERVVTYIDADLLGVQSDDEGYFFKAVFSILILISVTGILSTRYGLASEQAVSGIIFGVLLLLNNFNLIPTPPGTTFANLGNFLVALVGIILVVSIFREESR